MQAMRSEGFSFHQFNLLQQVFSACVTAVIHVCRLVLDLHHGDIYFSRPLGSWIVCCLH